MLLVDLTELLSSQKHGNFYFIQLIIIFQLFQVVQLMDVIMLFHLICYLINSVHFKFPGRHSPVKSPSWVSAFSFTELLVLLLLLNCNAIK